MSRFPFGLRPRRTAPVLPSWACVALVAACAIGCAKDPPTVPKTHTLSGRVRLAGVQRDAVGNATGNQVVDDADGVSVRLIRGGATIGSAATVDGAFQFTGLSAGTYHARVHVVGTIEHATPLLIVDSDRAFPAPLDLVPVGDLTAWPNPFTSEVKLHFFLPEAGVTELRVVDLGGALVAELLSMNLGAGQHQVRWDGTNGVGDPVVPGSYWVTFARGTDYRAELVFKE